MTTTPQPGIYLDHNATTPVAPEVLEAMLPFFTERFANPSSIHLPGQSVRSALNTAREQVARTVGASPEEVVFTGGGTESCNLGVKGLAFARGESAGHIVTTQTEHPAVLHSCEWLEGRSREVTYLPVDAWGQAAPDAVAESLRDDTALVAVIHANNEVGTLNPVTAIAAAAHKRGVPVFVDATQSFGKLPLNVADLGCDVMALSAHKVYGPKGVGVLYIRKGVRIASLLHGGGQEFGLRAGTENVPGIVGFGKACDLLADCLDDDISRWRRLRPELLRIVSELDAVRLNGHPTETILNTVNICFHGVDAITLAANLSRRGIHVSTGSACTEGSVEPSHVLRAMGLNPESCHSSLRLSMGRSTTLDDVRATVTALTELVPALRTVTAPEDIGDCGPDCPCFFDSGAVTLGPRLRGASGV